MPPTFRRFGPAVRSSHTAASLASEGERRRRMRVAREQRQCYHCHSPYHQIRRCPLLRPIRPQRHDGCCHCDSPNHQSRDCLFLPGQPNVTVAPSVVPPAPDARNRPTGPRPIASAFMSVLPALGYYIKSRLGTSTSSPSERPNGTFPIIFDSGASLSISPCKHDFGDSLKIATAGQVLQGIAKGVPVRGRGFITYLVRDAEGDLRSIRSEALYVPSAEARLVSTSAILASYPSETFKQTTEGLELSGTANNDDVPAPMRTNGIFVARDERTNLMIAQAVLPEALDLDASYGYSSPVVVSASNQNLSAAERELLRWHFRLGHAGLKRVQALMRTGALAHTEGARRLHAAASRLTTFPICTACQYGKQRRRSTPNKRTTVHDRHGAIRHKAMFPGQETSVDHFVCSAKGRLLHTKGKEGDDERYTGGAIFVDHASSFTFVKEQVHLNSHETLDSKYAYEMYCRDFGVVIQSYMSDNGSAFTSQEFNRHLEHFHQIQKLAGVGAHHHNGVSERAIGTIMSVARAMMIHATIHWPEFCDSSLWPLAVQYAVMIFNRMPDAATGLSPLDILARTRASHSHFQDFHVWGCPVFVLDKRIADGKKPTRWEPRSGRHVFVLSLIHI